MSMLPPADRADVRRDLARAIPPLSLAPDGSFSGTAHFGPALVGPPGRLHGGLHAYARLLPIWKALHGALPKRMRITLDILRPLRLEAPCAFTGRWHDNVLETTFLGARGLHGRATAARELPPALLPRFRALAADNPMVQEFKAAGTVPVRIGRSLVTMHAPSPEAIDEGNTVGRFLTEDKSADAVWICTALDLLAAVVQGVAWHSHVFTVRIDLTLTTRTLRGPVWLLGDTRSQPDPHVLLPPLDGRGPRKVAVLLTDPAVQTAYAWGDVTLYPTRHRLV